MPDPSQRGKEKELEGKTKLGSKWDNPIPFPSFLRSRTKNRIFLHVKHLWRTWEFSSWLGWKNQGVGIFKIFYFFPDKSVEEIKNHIPRFTFPGKASRLADSRLTPGIPCPQSFLASPVYPIFPMPAIFGSNSGYFFALQRNREVK